MVEVRRVSNRLIAVVLVCKEDVLTPIYRNAAQSGRCFEENEVLMMN